VREVVLHLVGVYLERLLVAIAYSLRKIVFATPFAVSGLQGPKMPPCEVWVCRWMLTVLAIVVKCAATREIIMSSSA